MSNLWLVFARLRTTPRETSSAISFAYPSLPCPLPPIAVARNKVTGRNCNKKLSRHNGGEDVIALSAGGFNKGHSTICYNLDFVARSSSDLSSSASCRTLLRERSRRGAAARRCPSGHSTDQPHCRLCFEATKQKMRSIRGGHCSQLASNRRGRCNRDDAALERSRFW